jgi:hypothetical protein
MVLLVPASTADAADLDGGTWLYGGYQWVDGVTWVPGLISMETWFTPAPEHSRGAAVFYGPGMMEGTARWRGMDLSNYLGGVALMSPADIGQTVWLKRPGEAWEGPYLVVDCAARQDMWPVIMARGEVVEVDFDTATRWGMVTPVNVSKGEYKVHKWQIEIQVLKSKYRPETGPGGFLGRDVGYLLSAHKLSSPVDYVSWFEGIARFVQAQDDYFRRPVYFSPDRWLWPDGTMVGPDDWDTFLKHRQAEPVVCSFGVDITRLSVACNAN